jgi:hypothetical protein
MTPPHNDANKPKPRHRELSQKWGLVPILLAAAVIIVGTWAYMSIEDPTPVTGGARAMAQSW